MLVWQRFGCQLHSNAVVASVMKDFKFVKQSTEAVLGCHIGATSITYYPKIKSELSIDLLSQIILYVLILLQYT